MPLMLRDFVCLACGGAETSIPQMHSGSAAKTVKSPYKPYAITDSAFASSTLPQDVYLMRDIEVKIGC